jgi:hypothetical protein
MNKKWIKAGITTYVMMMLGFAIMFFLFGFTTIWSSYTSSPAIGDTGVDISQTGAVSPNTFLSINNILLYGVAGGGLIVIGTFILGRIFGVAGTLLQIVFPIYLLMICNIFIFPVIPGGETHLNDVFPIAGFLIGFFNLWFLLAVIEFIRG